MKRRRILISDFDDTLCFTAHRSHWLANASLTKEERWRFFFRDCGKDPANKIVIEAVNRLRAVSFFDDLHILSGRSREVETESRAWLKDHGVLYDELRMREPDDHRAAPELKRGWIQEYNPAKVEIILALDDDPEVAEMLEELGIPCWLVARPRFKSREASTTG